jgi:hypothetical protein
MTRTLVRIDPAARGGSGKHFGRAVLVGMDGDIALIKPLGRHRRVERIPAKYVKVWKGKEFASG